MQITAETQFANISAFIAQLCFVSGFRSAEVKHHTNNFQVFFADRREREQQSEIFNPIFPTIRIYARK